MRVLLLEEFRYILPHLVLGFGAFIYYRERGVVHLNPYSTFWPRFLASSVDAVVLWPITGLIPMLTVYLAEYSDTQSFWIYSIVALIIPVYSVVAHGLYGATVGKYVCKIVVLDAKTKRRISFKQAFIRDSVPIILAVSWIVWIALSGGADSVTETTAFYAIPLIYMGWFLAEVITMLSNSRRRAIHDFMAGTVVIRHDWN